MFSLVWATLCATLVNAAIQWIACEMWGFFPRRGGWGTTSWSRFKEIFDYGRDLFLVSAGRAGDFGQPDDDYHPPAGPGKCDGVERGHPHFRLVREAIGRVILSPLSAFSEMMVRGERTRLRDRYRSLVVLVASLSVFMGVSFALCNSVFVTVLTSAHCLAAAE